MANWWVTTELDEYGGFQRDWFGPYSSEAEAEKVAIAQSKRTQELVAEIVFGPVGRDGARFAEFVRGKRHAPGASGWFSVKPPASVKIPTSAQNKYPAP